MKKIVLIVILAAGLFFFMGCGEDRDAAADQSPEGEYSDGVYTGTGEGFYGDIVVTVTVEGGAITSVIVDEHEETDDIAEPAFEALATQVIANQGTEGVDVETGATGSSEGFIEAVENALEDAQ